MLERRIHGAEYSPQRRLADWIMSATAMPIRCREARSGPEHSLVNWFLNEKRLILRADYRISTFREPAIESGTPDIVLVVWKPSIARKWNSARGNEHEENRNARQQNREPHEPRASIMDSTSGR